MIISHDLDVVFAGPLGWDWCRVSSGDK